MRHKKLVEYRRPEVSRLLVLGGTQDSMAKVLHVSQATISKDVEWLDASAAEELKQHVQKKLPRVHLTCSQGIDQVLRTAWGIVSSTKNDYVRIHALNLIHQAYLSKQNLASDGTIINNALELIKKSKQELKKLEDGAPDSSFGEEAITANLAALSRARNAKASAIQLTDMSGLGLEEGGIVIGGSQHAETVEEAEGSERMSLVGNGQPEKNAQTQEATPESEGPAHEDTAENDSLPERNGSDKEWLVRNATKESLLTPAATDDQTAATAATADHDLEVSSQSMMEIKGYCDRNLLDIQTTYDYDCDYR